MCRITVVVCHVRHMMKLPLFSSSIATMLFIGGMTLFIQQLPLVMAKPTGLAGHTWETRGSGHSRPGRCLVQPSRG